MKNKLKMVEDRHALEDLAKMCDPQHDMKRQSRIRPPPLATFGDKLREAMEKR